MADFGEIINRIRHADNGAGAYTAAPSMLAVTLIFLIAVLSVPVQQPQRLIWLAAYPIIASEISGIGFGKVFIRSLWILPLVVVIGIFNPILDTEEAFPVGTIIISKGWVSFFSILLRGLLSMQSLVLLVSSTGFLDLFNSLRKIGCPEVLSTQLLLTYRYISVLTEEVAIMSRARKARGYGRKNYSIQEWGRFTGQLLIRSAQRAAGIHKAMLARGFDGSLPLGHSMKWNGTAWLWLLGWTIFIAALRFFDFSSLFVKFF